MWTEMCLGLSIVAAAFVVAVAAPFVANAIVNAEQERPRRVPVAAAPSPDGGTSASGTTAPVTMPDAASNF